MNIETSDADLDESKTLKVTLPAKLHLRLHSLKILSGQTISSTVEEALVKFFDEELDEEPNILPDE